MTTFRMLFSIAAAAVALLAVPTVASAASAVFDLDLRTSDGVRVASVAGSVNARGTGFADLVPLSGAPPVGMRRDEAAVATREADGSILVRGGLGTRIRIRIDSANGTASASGSLALDLRAARVVAVSGAGVSTDRPYTPRKGDVVLAIGYPSGPIRIALARRYRVVRYSAAKWSRTALLAHPKRLASVAGVLIGPSVSANRLRHLDLIRALYNAGRWTATSTTPLAFDRHMYVVSHAHVGRGGVILRHPGGTPGRVSRTYMQIREPRIARVRIGSARVGRDTVPRSMVSAAVRSGIDRLTEEITARETPTGEPQGASRRAGAPATRQATCPTPGPSSPATVCATGTAPAFYTVPITQDFQVVLSAPNALAAYGIKWGCNQNESGNAYFTGACPGRTNTQTIEVEYQPVYTVSLLPGGGSTNTTQLVTETSTTTIDSVASIAQQPSSACPAGAQPSPGPTHLAQGVYNQVTDTVCPTTWSNANYFTSGEGCRFGCYVPALNSAPQESALLFTVGYHSIVLACTGYPGAPSGNCANTMPSSPVSVIESGANSAPTQQVIQVQANYTTGTNWETSQTSSSSWDVSTNLGFFGGEPMGGVGGGYSSGTSTTNSVGGNVQSSVSYTVSNWQTNPTFSNPVNFPQNGQWTYVTSSINVPNAQGDTASAASSVGYQAATSETNSGYVPTPALFGGSGPAPVCASSQRSACDQVAQTAGWGSGENLNGYVQGSTASFGIKAEDGLAVGTASPAIVDNFYFADQWNLVGGQPYSSFDGYGPGLVAFSELQIQNQSDIFGGSLDTSGTAQPVTPSYVGGAGNVGGTTTYYNAQGQVSDGPQAGGYQTIGLDLCAPPVLTSEMWTSGCDTDPMLVGAGSPPATVAGANPTILVNGAPATLDNGQPSFFMPGTLTCEPGTWSGDPTFAYSWQVWLPTTSIWAPVTKANGTVSQNGQAFTPKTPGGYTCDVTATNAAAPSGVSAQSASILANPPT
ncbi:MAG: hypothetical protein ACR2J9_02080 [Gaiellales bacterium]